jgi:hypothetical protein
MSVPQVPSTPPRQPRSAIATALLLIAGLLLLAPGVCSVIFIREYMYMRSIYPDGIPAGAYMGSDIWVLWVISFIISAGGIGLIISAFRWYRTARTP